MKNNRISAAIIAVGDEVLFGDTVNTNAAYIARSLDDIGIRTLYQSVIPDEWDTVKAETHRAWDQVDVLVFCGGLGPTADDLTKEAVSGALGLPLIQDDYTQKKNEDLFARWNITMTANNNKQSLIPEGSLAIENNNGTAPGIWLEKDGKIVVLLPGPPGENTPMMEDFVLPKLKKLGGTGYAERYYMLTLDDGESAAEQAIRDNIDTDENYTLNTYVGDGFIRVKATAYADNFEAAEALIAKKDPEVKALFKGRLYSVGNEDIADWVCAYLIEHSLSVSCAESCTGGLIAARFTDYSGISAVFSGGAVTYCNEAKMKLLGVRKETIDEYTEVSWQTAEEMAKGAALLYGTDIAVSTTGIAGPTGGTEEKPVGLVYTGIYYKGRVGHIRTVYRGNRSKVRSRAVAGAFALIKKYIDEENAK